MLTFARNSPYWPVVTHPVLRLLLPGIAISYLGDGMALVGIVVLAQHLTPDASLVGLAVAASTLPGGLSGLVLGRWLRRRPGAQLAGWDALLRMVALGVIGVAGLVGGLGIAAYVVLLALSSLLHAWGLAGRYTLMAELLPEDQRLTGNAVPSALASTGTLLGPPAAGAIIAITGSSAGAATVIAVDAATFAVLAASYAVVLRRARTVLTRAADRTDTTDTTETTTGDAPPAESGFRILLAHRGLFGLLVLSVAYYLAFGPVYVALPTSLAALHHDPTLLGFYYTAFSVGALAGAATVGYLRLDLWTTLIGIILGFGIAMLPVALGAPTAIALPAFGVAGAIWAPFTATSVALLQANTTPTQRTSVLAANSSVLVLAVPVGTAIGGPAVQQFGPGAVLTASAVTIITLGVLVGLARLGSTSRRRVPQH